MLPENALGRVTTETTRIASEPLGEGLFRQVHKITITGRDGQRLQAIAVNDASAEECSVSPVQIYVIRRALPP